MNQEATKEGGNTRTSARIDGSISGWETERGFGWIKHEGGSLFAHISDFPKGFIPKEGDKVTFTEGLDPKGRLSAKELKPERRNIRPLVMACVKLLPLLVLPFLANLKLPVAVWMLPAAMFPTSVAAWIMYRVDKKRAEQKHWRVTETELHGLELFGGWPGAFLAQQTYRHKTRKLGYQAIFWCIVFLHQLVALDMVLDHLLWKEFVKFLHEMFFPSAI